MRTMYLAVGYNCNHNCFFCPCGKKERRVKKASLDELEEAVDLAVREQHVESITISGGEPTLHPGFPELISFCLDKGLEICILSNGENFFHRERIRDFFGEPGRGRIEVVTVLHSYIPAVHEELNGTKGSFERTIQGLKNLVEENIPVTVKHILCSRNHKDLPDFVDFIFETFGGKTAMEFTGMDYCGLKKKQADQIHAGFREMGIMLEKALDRIDFYRKEYGVFRHVAVSDFPLCSTDPLYWRFFASSSRNGTASYAAPDENAGKVWQISDMDGDCGLFYEECRDCLMKRDCPGVWRYASIYYPDGKKEGIRTIHAV